MNKMFHKGELWVIAQVGLLAVHLSMVLRFARPVFPALTILGVILTLIGFGILFLSMVQLGRNLTPNPQPLEEAELVTTGFYSVVRHPIYFSQIVLCLGMTFVTQSFPSIVTMFFVFGFFNLKSAREEDWLNKRYPEYQDYSKKVKKLIPWVF